MCSLQTILASAQFYFFKTLCALLAVHARVHQPLQRLGRAAEALHRAHESDAERRHTARHAAVCNALSCRGLRRSRCAQVCSLCTLLSYTFILCTSRGTFSSRSTNYGFEGGMRRWGMAGGPKTHGTTKWHRRIGSSAGGHVRTVLILYYSH